MERLFGVRSVAELGALTFSPQAGADLPIVHRSSSLYDDGKLYGPSFRASPILEVCKHYHCHRHQSSPQNRPRCTSLVRLSDGSLKNSFTSPDKDQPRSKYSHYQ